MAFLRSLISLSIYPLVTTVYSLITVLIGLLPQTKNLQNSVIQSWAKTSCWLFGVKVQLLGQPIKSNQGCIYLFNHTSYFDIFALFSQFSDFRFGAKIELFKIPFFGQAMKAVGVLPIARNRKEEVFKVYQEASSRLQKGEKFALAPEGTRQPEEKIGHFKSGPFIFAINCQVPVVPVVIQGAHGVFSKKHWIPNSQHWQSCIRVSILEPISTLGMTSEQRQLLQNKVQEHMILELERLKK